MAVLAIVLVSALRVSTDGGWRVDRSAHRLALVRMADRLIERADVDLSLAGGPLTGTDGGASWRLERSPFVVTEPSTDDASKDFASSLGFGDQTTSDDPSGLSGLGKSPGLIAADQQGDAKDPGASIDVKTKDQQDSTSPSGRPAMADLTNRKKPGLWLIKATVSDASGEQVELSTLRLENGS